MGRRELTRCVQWSVETSVASCEVLANPETSGIYNPLCGYLIIVYCLVLCSTPEKFRIRGYTGYVGTAACSPIHAFHLFLSPIGFIALPSLVEQFSPNQAVRDTVLECLLIHWTAGGHCLHKSKNTHKCCTSKYDSIILVVELYDDRK